ncbi:hypothetical protein E2C01_025193 [Portunus trituberculatus]|uniref:Uncharacterized protein n=1 Tax=Portunus trituberculatus TaxID=210409 RepID=A0A5B7EFV5_PORTR|nr:hypothetical protein [Portunus trituberculatus]
MGSYHHQTTPLHHHVTPHTGNHGDVIPSVEPQPQDPRSAKHSHVASASDTSGARAGDSSKIT